MRRLPAVAALVAVTLIVGCRTSGRPLILADARAGREWYWPYFLDNKSTVVAFWDTESLACIDSVPGLNTLNRLRTPVQLVSVATTPSARRLDACIRGQYRYPVEFVVLVDEKRRLAKKLDVTKYPTYIYFDQDGDEVARTSDISKIDEWFRKEAWLRRSGAIRD